MRDTALHGPRQALASVLALFLAALPLFVQAATPGRVTTAAASAAAAGTEDPATWPKWRKGLRRWQWVAIPGTDLSSIKPDPPVPGSLRARIDAWNGLAADTRTNRLYSAANGGHADYSGNEVYELDLSVDEPRWVMLRPPTPESQIVRSDYNKKLYNDYYLDGRPASTHTYYSLHFLSSVGAIFKFGAGSLWGTGNEGNWKTDVFVLSKNDWDPPGSWPDIVPNFRDWVATVSKCLDPSNDQVYIAAPGGLRRFDPVQRRYQVVAQWLENSSAVNGRACAVDPKRKRVVFFGDAYRVPLGGLIYQMGAHSVSRISFSGPDAELITGREHFAWYEPDLDAFLLKTNKGSKVYSIDPDDYSVREVEVSGGEAMPDSMNGVQTRWQRLPLLGGYAYYPRSGSGVWFLATR